MASKHEINISDDYEDLCERKWFVDQIGKTFELRLRSEGGEAFTHTRGQRAAVQLGDEEIELETEDIEAEAVEEPEVEDMVEEYDLESDSDFS
jgi:hypothetical protein